MSWPWSTWSPASTRSPPLSPTWWVSPTWSCYQSSSLSWESQCCVTVVYHQCQPARYGHTVSIALLGHQWAGLYYHCHLDHDCLLTNSCLNNSVIGPILRNSRKSNISKLLSSLLYLILKVIDWNFWLCSDERSRKTLSHPSVSFAVSQRLIWNGNKRNAILWQHYDCASKRQDWQDNTQWKSLQCLRWLHNWSCQVKNLHLMIDDFLVLS